MHSHITPVEAALAGAGISALAGLTATLWGQRFTRKAGHTARLWEQRVEVYEFMLERAARWRHLRQDGMGEILNARIGDLIPSEDFAEDPERQRLNLRMAMFGEPDVQRAFSASTQADLAFVSAWLAWHRAAVGNTRAAQGEVPAHEAVPGHELVRLRKAAEAANDGADTAEQGLIAAVSKAVERIPRYQQRSTGLANIVRRKMIARKERKASQAELLA